MERTRLKYTGSKKRGEGEGRVCIIQPTVLPDGTVKLDVMLQNSSKLLAHTRVITPPDKYFEVECDGIGIGMAAHINP